MATFRHPGEEVGLGALMAESPEPGAHMSVPAEAGFLLGLVALLTAPFSDLFAVALLTAAAGFCLGAVGMITTRGPDVAGSALSAVGLFAALLAAGLVGLRYVGVDTAFGDGLAPWLWDQLQRWSARLPQPR